MNKTPKKTQNSTRYWPLAILIIISVLAALAIVYGTASNFFAWMHFFMGFFLCQFAMLKLFNPSNFADGFQRYDVVAKQSRGYAYLYPWIELGLGLAYLSFIYPTITYAITILVMGIGIIGVIQSMRSNVNVPCACMGTVLNVPLSTVTLSENIAMVVMALIMLLVAH